ncbi:unnamed protein product [Durusdinium trenchii]|uniref:Uncharacterized protein n=2 Tax=Durusdinium trenchii TaxID=1381693 RepID=A0ABP0IL36_9DINO
MEITLGNLTPSTPENPVHLAWWAPRKSQTAWNPHLNLEGCAVYRHMNSAYPKYSDVDFNGGNLQVDSNGQITIRFQAPATYYVTSWISVPHVHLRLCSNDTFAHTTQDAIVFIVDGPELVAGEAGSHLQILDYKNFTYAEKTGGPLRSVSDRDIIGVLTWRTTTPTTSSPFIDELVNNTDWDGLESGTN